MTKKTKKFMLSSFSIILIIIILLGIITHFLPSAECAELDNVTGECLSYVDGSGVFSAKLSDV